MPRCDQCGASLTFGRLPGSDYATYCDRIWRLALLRFMDGDKRPVTHADLPADADLIVAKGN